MVQGFAGGQPCRVGAGIREQAPLLQCPALCPQKSLVCAQPSELEGRGEGAGQVFVGS